MAAGPIEDGLRRALAVGVVRRHLNAETDVGRRRALNVAGALAAGFLWELVEGRIIAPDMRVFLFVGILGGFTTFSAFALENFHLMRDGEMAYAILNILLTVAPEIGAQRSGEKKENVGKTIDEMAAADAAREKMERGRYKMLYGIENHLAPEHYDIVLDTSSLAEDEVFQKIFAEISKKS